MSESPPSVPKRRPRAAVITLALLVAVTLTLWYGWKKPVEHLATHAFREALPRDVVVEKVEVNSPASISLVGVERGGASADEIKVTFSAISALRDGVTSGVERVELIRPTLRIDQDKASAKLTPSDWLEGIKEELQQLMASDMAGIGGASLVGASVVVTDGTIIIGDDEVVTKVRATLTPGPRGLSAQVGSANLYLGEVPWALRGEYRPLGGPPEKPGHGFQISGTRGDASVRLSGEVGDETSVSVDLRGVDISEVGQMLLGGDEFAAAWEPLAALGPVDGTLTLQGLMERPAVLGRLHGSLAEFGADESSAWELDLSGGGDAPIDARFSVDGDAVRVEYAPAEGGDLRITGAGLPIGLLARLIGLALGVDVDAAAFAGRADIDVAVADLEDGLLGTYEVKLSQFAYGSLSTTEGELAGNIRATDNGSSFDVSGALAGETSGAFAASGAWANGELSGSLGVPWAYLRSFSFVDGAFEFESSPRGGLALTGDAKVGGGSIEVREALFGTNGFDGEFQVVSSSAPAIVELLRALGVAFAGDRTMRGTVSGVVEVKSAAPDGLSVSGSLESDRLGYRDMDFSGASLVGMWSKRGWDVSSLVLERDQAQLTLAARGELDQIQGEGVLLDGPESMRARLDFSGGGRISEELRLTGKGVAGEGAVELDASWRPSDGTYALAAELGRFPLGILDGGWGAGLIQGSASGPLRFEANAGVWRAEADLSIQDLQSGDVVLRVGRLEVDLGSVSSGGRAGDEVTDCDGCLFGYGRLWGDLEVAGESGTKSVDARVDFSGDEGSVSVLPIKVWGGEVTAGGTLGLLDGAWGLDLWSGGRRIAYEDDGVKGLVNFDLALSGPLNSPSISGAFQVDEGKVDLLRLPTLPSLGATKQGSARRGYDPSLDLQIEIEAAEVSAGTFLKGQMAGAVGIKGSVKDPQLFGEVALIRGDFRYLGSRFDATVGTVQFRGANLPRLEMVGTRKVGDVKITAAVSGPADDLKLHLSSDPPLAQSEILELLNVPASVDMSEGWGELARSLANLANAELASQVYWRLGQAVENALDLDQFRVDQNGGAVQLTIGKYVNPDLYLSYTRTLGGAASQDIAAEYRIGPNMTLTSEWDFEEKRDVGIEISVPF